jgi:hypothetical protein
MTIKANADGRTLAVLGELIEKRVKALKNSMSEAVIATAINILTSLKSATRKAPLKPKKTMYTIELTPYVAGWKREGGKFRRVVRSSEKGGTLQDVTAHCRNCAGQHYIRGERVKVYKATIANTHMNRREYYAFATSKKQAENYFKSIVERVLKKESGMAKYVLGIAQAKVSNRPMKDEKPHGAKQWQIAHEAGIINIDESGFSSGVVHFSFTDDLEYSVGALRGGRDALTVAMKKAANRTAGMIHKAYKDRRFNEDVQTPFPEVQRRQKR